MLRPSIAHRAVEVLAGGKICYDVTYHIDALRRRTVSQRHETGSPHVILSGCSTALGEGLPDEQTL